jgi:hypothetical protein
VSVMRLPSRFAQSLALVEMIGDQVFTNHRSISRYGLKKHPLSYDVWMKFQDNIIAVQSLTREIIFVCTDPNEATAVKFQSFIERGIRQGMKAVETDVT